MTLTEGATGASVLSALLRQAQVEFSDAFDGLELPSETSSFKSRFAALLPIFEGARLESEHASAIARALTLGAAAHLRVGESALSDVLQEPTRALPTVRVDLPGPRRLVPSADYAGRLYVESELAQLGAELTQSRYATEALARALTRVSENGRGLSLAGERFVLFGAGAELSPVYTLLEAGAEVLWLDRTRPPIDRLLEPQLGGALLYVDRGVDLLTQPAEVRATIVDFARGKPVHLGLYAFASGNACPLLLSLTMNEIVRSLPSELVQTLSFLLAPTSVSPIYGEDASRADELRSTAPAMRRAMLRARSLSPGYLRVREQTSRGHDASRFDRLSRAVVPQQGASYQLSEYIAKRMAAEAMLAFGNTLDGQEGELAVFANMAPITSTRSLQSPMMEAAILGAASYDLLIAKPSTARSISSLLTVLDVLDHQQARTAGQVENNRDRDVNEHSSAPLLPSADLYTKQFHGGVHAQPYALDGLVRLAALKGIAQRPKLAFGLLR